MCETDDRFGLRLFAGDADGDGYDDLAVVVPGDSCVSGHGEGRHGSDPVGGPGFWDSVDLVNESLNSTTPWSGTAVWPRMDAAMESFLGDKPDWLARWRGLSENAVGGNGVFNGDTFP